uniref:Large subunit GTPase 1 homolog n=1 Tax=Ciona savignyi TaxID=51511 RepID=H2YG07_CIOSA
MGRKKAKAPGLGQSLINDRFGKKHTGHRHAAELSAEHDATQLNLQSVTELSSLDDFLATAQLAGTEFTAERLNVHFVTNETKGIISEEQKERIDAAQTEFQHLLGIPRRPPWTQETTKEELEKSETESFLSWRKKLAVIQDNDDLIITPYEKNLDFWRQLWRVIERSDVFVQIVDARDPLLFRCIDMETYVKEVDPSKQNVLLVNKADLLSSQQRSAWRSYFEKAGVSVVFWSAVLENEKLDDTYDCAQLEALDVEDLYDREKLIAFFKSLVDKPNKVVGMVGYPNVGKSSTVNTLMGVKKTAVSATPGRTKHFQTLHIDNELCLCDCPGLVFPSFVSNKAEMVLSGILPIDQMRDHVAPVNLLGRRIPRKVVEVTYGVNIQKPKEGEDPNRSPTASEILSAHALSRGFMTTHGQPDDSRSARVILKDYVNGKLLCSVAPPGVDDAEYKAWTISKVEKVVNCVPDVVSDDMAGVVARIQRLNKKDVGPGISEVEAAFFAPKDVRVFTKDGKQDLSGGKG